MKYLGENKYFSFRDNFCEPLDGEFCNPTVFSEFGMLIAAAGYKRFCIGCLNDKLRYLIYPLGAGLSAVGCEVCISENTCLPSIRHGIPLLSAECGIYVSGEDCVKISFFDENGYPMNNENINKIINSENINGKNCCGRITFTDSLCEFYRNDLKSIFGSSIKLKASVSCGNSSLRNLWLDFFTGNEEDLVFQVSDDGQRVNAYSTSIGFISYERLILAYCIAFGNKEEIIYLPKSFHYIAESEADKHNFKISRFNYEDGYPYEAVKQRFLGDPLYMCLKLISDYERFEKIIESMPGFSSAVREIAIDTAINMDDREIVNGKGKIIISKSGKNRISLLAQSYSIETAAELCCEYDMKIKFSKSCNNLFHSDNKIY